MLTRLHVRGFKSLHDVEVEFGPFTCVAGLNGVGKSNLFDAIRFLHLLATRSIAEAVTGTSHRRRPVAGPGGAVHRPGRRRAGPGDAVHRGPADAPTGAGPVRRRGGLRGGGRALRSGVPAGPRRTEPPAGTGARVPEAPARSARSGGDCRSSRASRSSTPSWTGRKRSGSGSSTPRPRRRASSSRRRRRVTAGRRRRCRRRSRSARSWPVWRPASSPRSWPPTESSSRGGR